LARAGIEEVESDSGDAGFAGVGDAVLVWIVPDEIADRAEWRKVSEIRLNILLSVGESDGVAVRRGCDGEILRVGDGDDVISCGEIFKNVISVRVGGFCVEFWFAGVELPVSVRVIVEIERDSCDAGFGWILKSVLVVVVPHEVSDRCGGVFEKSEIGGGDRLSCGERDGVRRSGSFGVPGGRVWDADGVVSGCEIRKLVRAVVRVRSGGGNDGSGSVEKFDGGCDSRFAGVAGLILIQIFPDAVADRCGRRSERGRGGEEKCTDSVVVGGGFNLKTKICVAGGDGQIWRKIVIPVYTF